MSERSELARPREEATRSRRAVDLGGDLDAILNRALARDPEARYASVERLDADIRRHLGNYPVRARRGEVLYRARRFLRRNRLPVASAAVIVVLLGGFFLNQARQVREVRRAAVALAELLKALQPTSTDRHEDLKKALDEAAEVVDNPLFADQRPALLDALGRTNTRIERYDIALPQLREALELRRQELGDDHWLVADSLQNLAFLEGRAKEYATAEEHLREALEIREKYWGDDVLNLAKIKNNLAELLYDQKRFGEAAVLAREVMALREEKLGADDSDTCLARSNLASILRKLGEECEAGALYRENLERRRRLYGDGHKDVASSRRQLAIWLRDQGALEEAESQAREALLVRAEIFGDARETKSAQDVLDSILQARDQGHGLQTKNACEAARPSS